MRSRYAEASDLKNLTSATTSANIPFGYSSVWISPRVVEDAASALAQKHQLEEQQALERERKGVEEKQLEEQRQKDERDRAENQQGALRQQYEGPAKAAASAIASEVKELAENPSEENLTGLTAQRFPRFAEWVAQLRPTIRRSCPSIPRSTIMAYRTLRAVR